LRNTRNQGAKEKRRLPPAANGGESLTKNFSHEVYKGHTVF